MAKKKEIKEEAKEEVKEVKEKKPSKSKITCTDCGEVKAVRPEVFDKRVEKYGSEEKLRAGYLCLKCRPKKEKEVKKKDDKEE